MMAILTLVFLAAIVGIAKPYIGQMRRKHFAGAAVGAFIGMMVVSTQVTEKPTKTGKTTVVLSENSASSSVAADAVPVEVKSNWTYEDSKDEMRGTSRSLAEVVSNNVIDLDFPYGNVHGMITLRKDPHSGSEIYFRVEKGQILCNSFSESYIFVKFDNGPIQKMPCSGMSDGSSKAAFIQPGARMLAGLRRSKKTIIEAEFFQRGNRQFVFDTEGLKWK